MNQAAIAGLLKSRSRSIQLPTPGELLATSLRIAATLRDCSESRLKGAAAFGASKIARPIVEFAFSSKRISSFLSHTLPLAQTQVRHTDRRTQAETKHCVKSLLLESPTMQLFRVGIAASAVVSRGKLPQLSDSHRSTSRHRGLTRNWAAGDGVRSLPVRGNMVLTLDIFVPGSDNPQVAPF